MIFKPELVRLIHQGKKTMTRRPAKPEPGSTWYEGGCKIKPGRVYGAQPGRAKPAALRVTVTDVHLERLGDISLDDARREGFKTREEFFAYWEQLYGRVNLDLQVWVVEFVKGDVTDRPRLLAARPGAPHGDYVEDPARAMRGEPEAVSGDALKRMVEENKAKPKISRLEVWEEKREQINEALCSLRLESDLGRVVHRRLVKLERELAAIDTVIANEAAAAA